MTRPLHPAVPVLVLGLLGAASPRIALGQEPGSAPSGASATGSAPGTARDAAPLPVQPPLGPHAPMPVFRGSPFVAPMPVLLAPHTRGGGAAPPTGRGAAVVLLPAPDAERGEADGSCPPRGTDTPPS
jgi:hypothetical protein